jgi:hypothetical protein
MIKKNRVFQLFMILSGIVLTRCSKDDDGIKYNDEYQGGIVFYIFQEGDVGYIPGETHGLIVSFEDLQTSEGELEVAWGCCNDGFDCLDIPEAENYEIGSGKSNTEAILNACDEKDIAARLCDDYSKEYNGVVYGDWYLPNHFELSLLDADSNYIDPNAFYWSSSQVSSNSAELFYQDADYCYGNGPDARDTCYFMHNEIQEKVYKCKVKAVRNF